MKTNARLVTSRPRRGVLMGLTMLGLALIGLGLVELTSTRAQSGHRPEQAPHMAWNLRASSAPEENFGHVGKRGNVDDDTNVISAAQTKERTIADSRTKTRDDDDGNDLSTEFG